MAVLVAQHLDFDVARIGNEFFDEHAVVAETRFRLGAGAGEIFRHFRLAENAMRMPLPPPPADALIITG